MIDVANVLSCTKYFPVLVAIEIHLSITIFSNLDSWLASFHPLLIIMLCHNSGLIPKYPFNYLIRLLKLYIFIYIYILVTWRLTCSINKILKFFLVNVNMVVYCKKYMIWLLKQNSFNRLYVALVIKQIRYAVLPWCKSSL